MSQGAVRNRKTKPLCSLKGGLLGLSLAGLVSGSASASVVTTKTLTDFAGTSTSIVLNGVSAFTFSDVRAGDPFDPNAVGVVTASNAAVTSFFGQPTSFFTPARDFVEFGPGTAFTSYSSPAAIPFSLSTFAIGLADTVAGQTFYGYAAFDGLTLQSYSFETTPGTSIVLPVPIPASAPMFGAAVLAFGAVGYGVKRRQAAAAA